MKKYSLIILFIIGLMVKFPNMFASNGNREFRILIEEETVKEIILVSANDIKIIKRNNLSFLQRGSLWELELFEEENFKLIILDNYYVVCSFDDGKIRIRKVDHHGKILLDRYLDENRVDKNFDCKFYNGYFYFVGSVEDYYSNKFIQAKASKNVDKQDAFIIKASEDFGDITVKVFGGYLNESFERILINDNNLFILGYKDQITGGDFGNGGRYLSGNLIIAKINTSLQLIDYNVININSSLIDLTFNDDFLYIITDRNFLCLDFNLRVVNSIQVDGVIYSYLGNGLLALFTTTDILIFDGFRLDFQFNYKTEEIDEMYITIVNDAFYLYSIQKDNIKQKVIDLILIENNTKGLCILDYCPMPNETIKVSTLFNEARLINTLSTPYFDRNIHGNYEFILTFLIRENKEFIISSFLEVCLESNVSDGGIYPLGYRLKFTGLATLNNQEIFNNYPLDREGTYELILLDCNNKETKYNFRVDSEQFSFSEPFYKTWDVTTFKNSRFNIEISLSKENYADLENIIFNKEYDKIYYDETEEVLKVYFSSPNQDGLYVYSLDSLTIKGKIKKYNYLYIVNVLKNPPLLDVVPTKDNTTYQCSFNDADQVLRYLEVKVIQNQKEYLYKYPLGNNLISIYNVDKNQGIKIEISFAYDLGNNIIKNIKILNLELFAKKDKLSLGYIELSKSSENIEEISLELDASNKGFDIKSITYNQSDILFKPKSKKYLFFILPLLAGFSFFLTRGLKMSKLKKLRKSKTP